MAVLPRLQRNSAFLPGWDHFHHVLLDASYGVRQTLGILSGLQLIYAVIGLVGHFAGAPDVVMFAARSVLGLLRRFVIVRIAKLYQRRKLRKLVVTSA